ncbi:MAG: zinc ribbon domain-containing protein [Deltaproteobacteria bacterium]|nr:zinc ribbon domain-containing protein [Deltaproteobacteria bacterium]
MPIYEYGCDECGKRFESLVFGAEKPEGCPSCHGVKIRRLLSSCSFVSKGKSGEIVRSSASSCSGCHAASCDNCGH